ncbi:hypothetical protein DFH09DRAFT_942720 [Mycena vulgaris]|nr:hypothetical protein DFH09DRAFT_942720 [Mycena vulgaris]
MTTITRNLPWFIRDLGVSIVGQKCYTSLIENLDIGDVQCIKYSISKGLGIGIVLGGSIMKVPQLILIINAKSARGLSLPAYILETLSYAITLAYASRNAFPFSTYGENLFLTIQNLLITLLIIVYAPSSAKSSPVPALLMLFSLPALALIPLSLLAALQLTTLPLALFSKIPQIRQNRAARSTGQLSAFAVGSQIAGCAARLFTTATEVGDTLVAAGFALALALNVVLGVQLWAYWGRDDIQGGIPYKERAQVQEKVQAYEPAPWQQRAATPPPAQAGRKWARKVD